MALASGTHLGQYEILAPLGAGGMGEVYRARDSKLGREVAIKILPEAFAADAERIARFQREARTLAALNHPNIAIIHGLEEGQAGLAKTPDSPSWPAVPTQPAVPALPAIRFLVMELVDGEDLSQRIARGAIPLDEALAIATQIAEALEAAHDQGIVHRDLKPANIKVRDDGRIKVLDFGLAKVAQASGSGLQAPGELSQSPTITSPAMTAAGVILGTAAYMSPEQAKGRPADKRSDVWAFGCVLYEMLTGERPFDGEDTTDVLGAVVRLEPDWSRVPATVPPGILALVKGCLVKDRRQRVGDIAAALFTIKTPALTRAQEPARTTTTTARQPWARRAVPFVLVAAVVCAVTWLAVSTLQRPATVAPTVTRFPIELGDGQNFTNTGRNSVAIAPDSSRIAYVANSRLYLRSLSELTARPIAGTEGAAVTSPVFSPDGLSLAFYVDSALKRISVNGGVAVTLCPATNPFGLDWGEDGLVFGQGPQGILRVSPNGGAPEVLVAMKDGEVAHGPHLLPGGKAVLFTLATTAGADRWDKAQIVVQPLGTGDRKVLLTGGSDARFVSTGHLVYAVSGSLYAVRFDPQRLELEGGPTPVLEGIKRASGSLANNPATTHFDLSRTGALVYVAGPTSAAAIGMRDLALIDRSGQVTGLKLPSGTYHAPRVSPDGTRVAFASDDGTDASVWIYALSGASAMQKLTLTGKNRFPVWTPDSQRVAFQSDREGDAGIFWQRADGTGAAERLTRPAPGTVHAPESWSPKGDTLLFSATKDSKASLWMLSLHDKTVQAFGNLTSVETMDPVFSPDGHWVAYDVVEAGANGQGQLYLEPFPRTGDRYLATKENARNAFWTADGTSLVYGSGPGQFAAVTVSTRPSVTFGNPVSVPRGTLGAPSPAERRNYDPTPDGKILGVVLAGLAPIDGPPVIQVVLNWTEELKAKVPGK